MASLNPPDGPQERTSAKEILSGRQQLEAWNASQHQYLFQHSPILAPTTKRGTTQETISPRDIDIGSGQQSASSCQEKRQDVERLIVTAGRSDVDFEPQLPELTKSSSTATETGIYSCTNFDCPLRFDTWENMKLHKGRGHTGDHKLKGSITVPRLYWCDRTNPSTRAPCALSFKREYDFTRHEDCIHNNRRKRFSCSSCNGTFGRQDALIRHVRAKHPEVKLKNKRRRGAEECSPN
ncbi:hypothetical protein BJ875DRAFT_476424 [Amylocarpus encephaloides]|uniref:C2H2-type domain-containing protein n=1 Tax=Amylocarpus encephaloides TaxID=45428 RepID=A0A9P8BZV7_9HELO|nr:hypothetical protein BJ875DRAFT_476424 [Amylocarpus encephaloides]